MFTLPVGGRASAFDIRGLVLFKMHAFIYLNVVRCFSLQLLLGVRLKMTTCHYCALVFT